jgi:hypothetical protein
MSGTDWKQNPVRRSDEKQSAVQMALDNESRELILVGHTFSIVAEGAKYIADTPMATTV